MATILYSICGEGRGHATRVQTMVDSLRHEHRFILLAARDAYAHLYDRYEGDPRVAVRRIPGLFFAYRGTKVDYVRSIFSSLPYLRRLNYLTKYVARMIERDAPDLGITDFEPILPRAAIITGLPWVSFDHQHFLSTSDFNHLPWRYRWRAFFLRSCIPLFYRGQHAEIVSSFHHLPPREGTENVHRIGILLRESVIKAKPRRFHGNHIVVYMRRHAPNSLLNALHATGRECIVYGVGERPNEGRITFRAIADEEFVDDLASSYCLIATAGNQLLGEAHYLEKPVLAIPENGNFEQALNGQLLLHSKRGWVMTFRTLNSHSLQHFLLAVPGIRRHIDSDSVCGNQDAIRILSEALIGKSVNVKTTMSI